MNFRLHHLLIASAFFLFSGCGVVADGWSGPEDDSVASRLAERDCECLAGYYQAIGIDVQLLLRYHPALMEGRPHADEKVIREIHPDLPLELSKLRGAFLQWKREPPCHRSVTDELEREHLNFESIAQLLGRYCPLYQLSTTY